MKKLLLVMAIVACGFTASAQDFRAGISGGIPTGDASDFATFAIAVDLGYILEISDTFDAGVTAGFSHSFGEEINGFEVDDVQFLPLAAAGRLALSDQFSLGADVGYAIGINDGNDGGFYYAPRISYGVSDTIDIVAAYRGVSKDGSSWDMITFGIEFGL